MSDEPASAAGPVRYCVIDLAVAEDMRRVIAGLPPSVAAPLFARDSAPALLEVGPWLVDLHEAPAAESALAEVGAGLPWGYYIHSRAGLVALRLSLRRFNLARVPGAAKEVLFRYWDPRVMRVFLEVATDKQRALLFDTVVRIEAADGSFDAVKAA